MDLLAGHRRSARLAAVYHGCQAAGRQLELRHRSFAVRGHGDRVRPIAALHAGRSGQIDGLAFACLERVSPVAVLGVGERDVRYFPSLSRDRILQWLHELRRYRVDERTMLDRRLAELGAILNERALMIVLSDLREPPGIIRLKQLAQQHDCVAIQLRDPIERGTRGTGWFRAQEAESGNAFVSRGRQLGIDQQQLTDELRRGRVDHLLIDTDRPFIDRPRHFFKSRGLLGRGAR